MRPSQWSPTAASARRSAASSPPYSRSTPRVSKYATPSAAGSTAKPASSSEQTISSHACSAAAGSGSMRTSCGQVASASPSRICGRTPSASAAAVTGPSSGSPPGSGERAAGRSVRAGCLRKAAFSSNPGMDRQAITGTYVLHEHTFSCQAGVATDSGGQARCGGFSTALSTLRASHRDASSRVGVRYGRLRRRRRMQTPARRVRGRAARTPPRHARPGAAPQAPAGRPSKEE